MTSEKCSSCGSSSCPGAPAYKGLCNKAQSFKGRITSAISWEAFVGSRLALEGLYVLHYPYLDRDQKDVSEPDLEVMAVYDPCLRGVDVEVKSIHQDFTCPGDYPMQDVLVCSQNSFLNKWPGRDYTCRDFLFVSRYSKAIVWLPTLTKVELGHETFDSKRGELYKVVRAKREQLKTFMEFVDYAKAATA